MKINGNGIYIKHPMLPTEWGATTMRARYSLHETQKEFAKRFFVSHITVLNWERGKSVSPLRIHRNIMEKLVVTLKKEGRWMLEDAFVVLYRTELERKGNALL